MKNLYRAGAPNREFNRRQFLKTTGAGLLGMAASGLGPPIFTPPVEAMDKAGDPAAEFLPDLDISLRATPGEVSIFPGMPTKIWHYTAELIKGESDRLIDLKGSYLGPIIKARRGERVRIRFYNGISQETIVHWHGLHVPAAMDGHPRYVIAKGQSYLYEFEVKNRAGTYWYHPHPHGRTGYQVYGGLAGLFLVSDEEERAAGLPKDEFDIPLVLQDRTFDRDNQLVYTSGHRMAQMTGFLGDSILVNGVPDFSLPVSTTAYRLRLLNGSNSRIYKLAWEDGGPLIVGTDGGLLEKPVTRRYTFLAPGERMELWADFGDRPVGYETAMVSLPFDTSQHLSLFKLKVAKNGTKGPPLPKRLSRLTAIEPGDAGNYGQPRQVYLGMGHMQWTINGRVFQMEGVADDEVVQLGSKAVWAIDNTGGGMMRMPHPIHLHGKPFRVIGRSGVRHDGYVDEGWKDTVLLMPGERAKILVDFGDYPGLFLYHCHNLEHEDMGMMRNYYVTA